MLPRRHAAQGVGGADADYDEMVIFNMGLAKKSIDYTMALASASLGIMTMVLILQGFSVFGFHIDSIVLTVLLPSLSVTPALKVFGGIGGKTRGCR